MMKIDLNCTFCNLHEGRTNVVEGIYTSFSNGVVFVGEAPGATEDLKGEPFVGQSGKMLDELLGSIDLHRGNVSIMNIIKCRPSNNRKPTSEEMNLCGDKWLKNQLKFMQPKLVVALGLTAAEWLLNDSNISVTNMRGNLFKHKEYPIFVSLHPAFALYKPENKKYLISDFKKIAKILGIEEEEEETYSMRDFLSG